MVCPSCHKETTAVKVGTGSYCQLCHARIDTAGPAGGSRRMIDLRPSRNHLPTDDGASGPAAAQLHRRATPAGRNVLDLRQSPAQPTVSAGTAILTHRGGQPSATRANPAGSSFKNLRLQQLEQKRAAAQGVNRSQFIAKFDHQLKALINEGISGGGGSAPAASAKAIPHHAALPPEPKLPSLPASAVTQHAVMTHMAAAQPAAGGRPTGGIAALGRIGTMGAAVAIMGGYIWLQNAPKMAIQSAGNKAGLAASLPGYVPSSYTLANTNTQPGLVTLSFHSPSQPSALTINQQRTNWDSQSLLDNIVSKKTADYSAVQGQGLTIYLYGQNQASWVNHGIWYSIEGTSRLSREQILKIAYSL